MDASSALAWSMVTPSRSRPPMNSQVARRDVNSAVRRPGMAWVNIESGTQRSPFRSVVPWKPGEATPTIVNG